MRVLKTYAIYSVCHIADPQCPKGEAVFPKEESGIQYDLLAEHRLDANLVDILVGEYLKFTNELNEKIDPKPSPSDKPLEQ